MSLNYLVILTCTRRSRTIKLIQHNLRRKNVHHLIKQIVIPGETFPKYCFQEHQETLIKAIIIINYTILLFLIATYPPKAIYVLTKHFIANLIPTPNTQIEFRVTAIGQSVFNIKFMERLLSQVHLSHL